MRTDGLLLQNTPPLRIPFRFFIVAPLFGVLAALLLLSGGTDAWNSRWTPEIMASTHLLTLGFVTMAMAGALFQVLPVLGGYHVPGQRWLAPTIQLLLVAGLVSLCLFFIRQGDPWRQASIALLGGSFTLFISALGSRLFRRGAGDSIFAIRLAVLCLMIAVSLGVVLLLAYGGHALPGLLHDAGTSHLRVALLGWVLLLMVGVSYQIIPMFHVTVDYPEYARLYVPSGIAVALVLLTFVTGRWISLIATTILILATGLYALVTLSLFRRRKRKVIDYTVRFWQLGLGCLLLSMLGYALSALKLVDVTPAIELFWGILIIPGFAVTVIIGVLHKIAPFLAWLHLQQAFLKHPQAMASLPTMHDMLPIRRARTQFRIHCIALLLLLSAPLHELITAVAAIALAIDFVWLEVSLLTVLRAYKHYLPQASTGMNISHSS